MKIAVVGANGQLGSDVAAAFVHLAKARTSTGAVLTVDGGNVAAMMR